MSFKAFIIFIIKQLILKQKFLTFYKLLTHYIVYDMLVLIHLVWRHADTYIINCCCIVWLNTLSLSFRFIPCDIFHTCHTPQKTEILYFYFANTIVLKNFLVLLLCVFVSNTLYFVLPSYPYSLFTESYLRKCNKKCLPQIWIDVLFLMIQCKIFMFYLLKIWLLSFEKHI